MKLTIQCLGYEVAADWYQGLNDSKILLILPGYSSTKKRQQMHAEAMVKLTGTSVLTFDYSGHGESPFKLRDTSPAQHLLEVTVAFDWLKANYLDAVISISGSSYGGFLASQLVQFRTFNNLVLRAPALYKPGKFYDKWSTRIDNLDAYRQESIRYKKNRDELSKHPLFAGASKFTGNTLVVVHEFDEIIPTETTNEYVNAFEAEKIVAKGLYHTIDKNDPSPDELALYQEHIANWLNKF